jgi:hypothetical protein
MMAQPDPMIDFAELDAQNWAIASGQLSALIGAGFALLVAKS